MKFVFEVQGRGKKCEEVLRGTRMEEMVVTEGIVAVEDRVVGSLGRSSLNFQDSASHANIRSVLCRQEITDL